MQRYEYDEEEQHSFFDWVNAVQEESIVDIRNIDLFAAVLESYGQFESLEAALGWKHVFNKAIEAEFDDNCRNLPHDNNVWDYQSYTEAE